MDYTSNKPNVNTPGWNDPPILTYDPSVSIGNVGGTKLNKRVAFPMNNTSITKQMNTNTVLPPLSPPGLPQSSGLSTPIVAGQSLPECSATDGSSDGDTMPQLQSNFLKLQEKCPSSEAGFQDAVKRIDIMMGMWVEGKFSNELKKDILQLSEDLAKGNLEDADSLHKTICMNYFSLCSSWIPGIRHFIHICKKVEISSKND